MGSKLSRSLRFRYEVAISVFLALIFNWMINPSWFVGEQRVLGPHDTQIPYLSSFATTLGLARKFDSSFNIQEFGTESYSFLSTGWFTTTSLLTALTFKILGLIFDLTGKDFLIIHNIIWVSYQIVIRTLGFLLSSRLLGINKLARILGSSLLLSVCFLNLSFYSLVGPVFSWFPLLYWIIFRIIKYRKTKDFMLLAIFLLLSYAQAPAFSVIYQGMAITILLVSFFLSNLRKNLQSLKKIDQMFKSINSKKSLRILGTFTQFRFITLLVSTTSLITFRISENFYLDFSSNFTIGQERLGGGFYSYQWLKSQLFANHSTAIFRLIDPTSNLPNTQWQFIGIATLLFFLIGSTKLRLGSQKSLFIFLVIIISIQFSITFPVEQFRMGTFYHTVLAILSLPLVAVGLVARLVLYFLFPLSFLFRAYSILVWFALFAICLIATRGISVLVTEISRSVNSFGRKKRFRVVQAYVIIFASLFIVDALILKNMLNSPEYGGDQARPLRIVSSSFDSKYFIPDYQLPNLAIGVPFFLIDTDIYVTPSSRAKILSDRPDAALFGTQSNSTGVYGFNLLSRFQKELDIYESRNINLRDLCIIQNAISVPFVSIDDPDSLSTWESVTKCPRRLKDEQVLYQPSTKIKMRVMQEIVLPSDQAKVYWDNFGIRYEWNIKEFTSLRMKSSGVSMKTSLVGIKEGTKTLHPVRGLPVSERTFDLNNWKADTLTMRHREISNKGKFIVQSFSPIFVNENGEAEIIFISPNETRINVALFKSQRVTFGIPCSKHVKIKVTDRSTSNEVSVSKCDRFLNANLKPGQYSVVISTKRSVPDQIMITTYIYFVGLLHFVFFHRRLIHDPETPI